MKGGFRSLRITQSIIAGLITLVIGSLFLVAAGFGSSGSDSASMTYTSLNYEATVLQNGDLRVDQHVTMDLYGREDEDDNDVPWRQLFQQYSNDQLLGDITDISVTDQNGNEFSQTDPLLPSEADSDGIDWDSQMADTWYIDTDATNDDGDSVTEIGWNIPTTMSAHSLSFTLSMTYEDAVVGHPDVAEFQWEPISASNTIPIENLNGTLTFPKGITADNSWGWLHYEGSDSTTSRGKKGSLEFSARNVHPGNYVALRTMFDSSAVSPTRESDEEVQQSILNEENQKEVDWRAQQQTNARLRLALWIVVALLIVALSVYSIMQAIKTHRGSQYQGDLDYWREPPDMSPAAAALLLKVIDPSKGKSSDITSATMLSLASKKAIVLLPGGFANYLSLKGPLENAASTPSTIFSAAPLKMRADDEETTTVAILPAAYNNREKLHLSASEDSALRALIHVGETAGRQAFDLVELSDFFKDNEPAAKKVYTALSEISSNGNREFESLKAAKSTASRHVLPNLLLIVLSTLALFLFASSGQILLGGIIGLPGLLVAVESIVWGSSQVLTPKGQELAGTVVGLRNYLLDFSTFQDRKVADLALWDRYLVYATAFGISKEVAEQLALAQPQVTDEQWLDSNAMAYPLIYSMYRPWAFNSTDTPGSALAHSGIGSNFSIGSIGEQLSSNLGEIQSTIGSALGSDSPSGGSFGGGGFGGGGGGVGGGSFGGR